MLDAGGMLQLAAAGEGKPASSIKPDSIEMEF
jgi:hypothetical protein